MYEDHRGGGVFERAARDFAGVDGRVIDRALIHHFVGDELVLRVEEENAELFAWLMRHGEAAIVHQRRPGRDDCALLQIAFRGALQQRLHKLEILRDDGAGALDFRKAMHGRAEHAGQRAELFQQRFGEGLGVDARDGAEKEEF